MKKISILCALTLVQVASPVVTTGELTAWYKNLRTLMRTEIKDRDIETVKDLASKLAQAAQDLENATVLENWVTSQNKYFCEEKPEGTYYDPVTKKYKPKMVQRYGPLVLDLLQTIVENQLSGLICAKMPKTLDDLVILVDQVIQADPTQVDVQMHDSLGRKYYKTSRGKQVPYDSTGSLMVKIAAKRAPVFVEGCAPYFEAVKKIAKTVFEASKQQDALRKIFKAIPVPEEKYKERYDWVKAQLGL